MKIIKFFEAKQEMMTSFPPENIKESIVVCEDCNKSLSIPEKLCKFDVESFDMAHKLNEQFEGHSDHNLWALLPMKNGEVFYCKFHEPKMSI